MNFNNKNKENERSFQMILFCFFSRILRFVGDGRKQSVVFFFEIDSRLLLLLRPFLSFTRPENEINYPTENIKRSADVENIGPFAGRSLFFLNKNKKHQPINKMKNIFNK